VPNPPRSYDPASSKYTPHDREWFKSRALAYLKSQGQQAQQVARPASKVAQARPGGAPLRAAQQQMKRTGRLPAAKPTGRGAGNGGGAGRANGGQRSVGVSMPRGGGAGARRGGRGGKK
jgi:hypothetical protein